MSAPNYTITFTGANLTITPAALTVTAQAASKVYGSNDPTFAYNAASFVNTVNVPIDGGVQINDTAANSLTGALGRTLSAQAENVGNNYVINQGTLAAANYTITYVSANLSITPATLTVAPASGQSKVYGGSDPAPFASQIVSGLLNGSVAVDGFYLNDTNNVTFTGNYTRATGENVGSYNFMKGNYALGGTGNANGNYNLVVTNTADTSGTTAQFAIAPAALTITANDQAKAYGQALNFGGTEFTATGLQYNETIGDVMLTSAGAAATAHVTAGPYAISASAPTGGTFAASNYTISYVMAR